MTDAAAPLSGRVLSVVSTLNTFQTRNGAASYLAQMGEMLVDLGATLDLFVLQPLGAGQLRVPSGPMDSYTRPFRSVTLRKAVRLGDHIYTTDPAAWIARLTKGRPVRDRVNRNWLAPPSSDQVAWARRRLAARHPDIVIANYFNAAAVFGTLPAGVGKTILMHDAVARRLDSYRQAGSTPDFSASVAEQEAEMLATADLVLAISTEEEAYAAAVAKGIKTLTLPHCITTPEPDLDTPRPPVALFIGARFDANIDALRWLLDAIWPRVMAMQPEAVLHVAGSVAEVDAVNWGPGVHRLGHVADLSATYATTRAALIPMRVGSGVKIKLIEALAHGVPAVATPIGAQGVSGAPAPSLRVADDADSFAEALLATLNDPDPSATRRATWAFAQAAFCPRTAAARLAGALLPLLKNQQASW